MLKQSKMTHTVFYTLLGIKKPYFYDILSGKTNPPPAEKQFAILRILKPDKETCSLFFELAAKERNEVPADIAKYLEVEINRNEIRLRSDYKKSINDLLRGE